jgi:hypothetical protein
MLPQPPQTNLQERATMSGQNKRTSERRAVKVPAKVHTGAGPITAEARNLSTSGIFLECSSRLDAGSEVDIVMILPKEVTGEDGNKWVCCHAVVRRVEENGGPGRYGVAAEVEKIQSLPEVNWPDMDRRVGGRRANERRKGERSEGGDRRGPDRRKS